MIISGLTLLALASVFAVEVAILFRFRRFEQDRRYTAVALESRELEQDKQIAALGVQYQDILTALTKISRCTDGLGKPLRPARPA